MQTTTPTDTAGATADGRARSPASVRRLGCYGITTADSEAEAMIEAAPTEPIGLARSVHSHERITEAVVLSTCNRVEVYVSARQPADIDAALTAAGDALEAEDGEERTGRAVVEHLGRVACGLESEVLGEDRILGQVRRTFDEAAETNLAGGVLSRAADAAVALGRETRAETAINEGHVGYGSAACEVIAEQRPHPDRLVLVGAGEIARSVARAATHRWEPRIDVVNRSSVPDLPSADGRYWPLRSLQSALSNADAVVAATGANRAVITDADAAVLEAGTPVVDMAAPPDVAEEVAAGLPVTGLASIQTRVDATAARRRRAVPSVETLVGGAVERFVERERESRAEDAIRALHRQAASIRRSELERASRRVEAGEADVETVLADFASALTSRLLADPTEALRAAARRGDETTVAAARRLHNIQEEDL
jgi:glutamyl-tRNA reductase